MIFVRTDIDIYYLQICEIKKNWTETLPWLNLCSIPLLVLLIKEAKETISFLCFKVFFSQSRHTHRHYKEVCHVCPRLPGTISKKAFPAICVFDRTSSIVYARIYFGVIGTSYLNCNDGCFFSRRYLRRCMQRKEIIKTDLRFHIRE